MIDYERLKKIHQLAANTKKSIVHKFNLNYDGNIHELLEIWDPLHGRVCYLCLEDAIAALENEEIFFNHIKIVKD